MAKVVLDRARIKALLEREEAHFVTAHPKSFELYKKAQSCMIGGVPMHWMKRWEGRFPVFVKSGKGIAAYVLSVMPYYHTHAHMCTRQKKKKKEEERSVNTYTRICVINFCGPLIFKVLASKMLMAIPTLISAWETLDP